MQIQSWALAIGLSAIAIFSTACTKAEHAEAETAKPAELTSVAVAKAEPGDLSSDVSLTAEFKPFQEIDVMSKVAGYVKNINVDVGDRVNKGQILAVLEVPEMTDDITRAKASIDRAEAEVARARDELQRAQSAHQITHLSYERLISVDKKRPGLVAQQEIDDAHSKDLVSEAQINAAKSSLTAVTQQVDVYRAEMAKVRTLNDYTRVTAPFSGVITKRFADTGSMIQAGTASQTQAMPLVRLSENSQLRLILPVPESAVPSVHIGQNVEVKVPTLNRSFPGRVARFAGRVQTSTRTMETEVDVPNPSMVLVPGMYAQVNLQLQQHPHVLAIPVTAIEPDGDKPNSGKVLVVNSENRLELRLVQLGLETADRVEVRSGLHQGDMVVVGSRSGLKPNQHVKPKISTMVAASKS